jgi:CDGSH-type Zn-finger protein
MAATKITVLNNGSLRIEGEFEIVDQEGKTFGLAGRTKLSLCRCGQSAKKPFCDGSHKTCGFIGDQAAPGPKKMPAPPPIPEELK